MKMTVIFVEEEMNICMRCDNLVLPASISVYVLCVVILTCSKGELRECRNVPGLQICNVADALLEMLERLVLTL